MAVNFKACSFSHIGNSRDNQEDNFLLHQGGYLPSDVRDAMSDTRQTFTLEHTGEKDCFMVAVCDGMGGHSGGEVASMQSVRYLDACYENFVFSASLGEKSVSEEIVKLNKYIYDYSRTSGELKGMGATLCGVVSRGFDMFAFNVGDSRLYRLHGGTLEQMTTDHTEGQRLINLKLLSAEEAKTFPRRKNIYKYIGSANGCSPDVFRINCMPGDTLMLCTDGLTDSVSDSEITQILNSVSDIKDKGEKLIDLAVSRNVGLGDNITVIIVEF